MLHRRAGKEQESSYLEALSDLFVGFIFIFIIFLLLFALLLAEAQHRTEAVTTRLTDAGALRAQMLQEIEDALKRRGIQITIDTRTGIARLPESLLFESGSSELRADGADKLAIVAQELRAILPCYAYGLQPSGHCSPSAHPILDAMFVEGHTDNVQYTAGSFDNYDLSAQRSKRTFVALRTSAPDLDQLVNGSGQPLLSMSAYGASRPVRSNDTTDGQRVNRRIDLRFVVGTPSVEDIERARTSGKLSL
jgi:flagellar motor protein MotB